MIVVVTVEGGIVQGVSSDDALLVGHEVFVIDYDAEGADPDEVERVPQGEGVAEDATVSRHEVGALYAPVAAFLKERPT